MTSKDEEADLKRIYKELILEVKDLKQEIERLKPFEQLSTIDVLTGALNKAALYERLKAELADVERDEVSYRFERVLLFIDLDGFKAVNDQAGHLLGDEILVKVSDKLKVVLRNNDVLARYGGDEFIAIVTVRRATGLARLVKRVRKTIESVSVTRDDQTWNVGASIGSTILTPGDSSERVIERADQLMYENKAVRKTVR